MKLAEEIAIERTTIRVFGFTPPKRKGDPPKKRRKKVAKDATSKVALDLKAPLTRPVAVLLGVEELLYEHDSNAPHAGYTRITLDVDKLYTVQVKVRDSDRNAALEIQADCFEGFSVVEQKGTGPVLRWRLRATGYVSQLADFVAVIEDHEFTLVCSPVQGQLFDNATSQPADKTPNVYAV